MLEKLKKEDFNKYINYAYNLSQNMKTASYPIYTDGIKDKNDFIKTAYGSFELEFDEILLYKENNEVKGWIHYYYDADDDSIFAVTFLCDRLYNLMIKEFISFIKNKYPSAKIGLGFPSQNEQACKELIKNGFELVETSINNVLHTDVYQEKTHSNCVVKLDKKDFDLFRSLHDNIDIDIYWNSDRIYNNFENWRIYIYKEKDKVLGAIYSMDANILLEVFGIDYINNIVSDEIYENLLIAFINEAKKDGVKHIVYFNEYEEELKFLKSIGFKSLGEYRYYLKNI